MSQMSFIDLGKIELAKQSISNDWNDPKKPFKYFVYDDLFTPEAAELVMSEYPTTEQQGWDNTTYINQKNKYTKTTFDEGTVLDQVFKEMNGPQFLKIMEEITGIPALIADPKLFGGGLHQSTKGAFLDVHVDFNYHPETNYHRRMNIIVYMNKDWKKEYNGYLELWDMETKTQLEYVEPKFNRCVVFETNEVSFHGHPKPLNTPQGVSRKSLALYYYTKDRPANEISKDHNTIYVNTEGAKGAVKNLRSGFKALIDRLTK